MPRRLLCSLTILAACCAPALASHPTTSIYGHDLVTIGAPGNQGAKILDEGIGSIIRAGAIDYTFRVSRTEVTRGQWVEFIDAQRAFLPQTVGANSSAFTGGAAEWRGTGSDGLPVYEVTRPDLVDRPVTPSWEFVARYMNWLHNGKKPLGVATAADFETGAYTMANFGVNEPVTRNADARFFVMDFDEWTKAVYYDPNRYGEGQEGYWRYPDQSDTPLVPGAPGVGETSGGWDYVAAGATYPDVGAYGVETPWGLLDASGGVREWLETYGAETGEYGGDAAFRPLGGSQIRSEFSLTYDELGYISGANPRTGLFGFRVGMIVPSPGSGAVLVCCGALLAARRRR